MPKPRETSAIWGDPDNDTETVVPKFVKGVSVDQVAEYSIAVALEVQLHEVCNLEEENAKVFRRFRIIAKRAIEHIASEITIHAPDVLMYFQGYGIESAATRMLAAMHGLRTVSLENTALVDRMLWEGISGVTVNRNMARNIFWRYEDIVPRSEVNSFCDHLLTITKASKQLEHTSPNREWQSASKRPLILYLGQVYTDSSLLYGCYPDFGPETVVHTIYNWAMENEAEVFIKLHPKEAKGVAPVMSMPYRKLTLRKLITDTRTSSVIDSPHVTVDSDNLWDTYKLIEKADIVVTINSQAGLEAAVRGKNVITCGQCFYAGLGFTNDTCNANQLSAALTELNGIGYKSRKHQLAQKFFYIFFEKYCAAKTIPSLVQLLRRKIIGGCYCET